MSEAAPSIRVEPSQANAVVLAALGAALVSTIAAAVHLLGDELVYDGRHLWLLGAAPFALFLSGLLMLFGMCLSLRPHPVFEADPETISMPVGLSGLLRLPWEAVAGWGIAERRIPWLPLLKQRVFAVWLVDARAPRRTIRAEIALNRAILGADLVLSDWFVPRGFEAIVLTCRQIRPDLERPR